MARQSFGALMIGMVLALSACTETTPPVPQPAPVAPEPEVTEAPFVASKESLALQDYFASVETFYRTQGNLRTDGGGRDTPFDARRMTNAFLNIAFYNEFVTEGASSVQKKTQATLTRWEGPLRVNVSFGRFLSEADIARDERAVTSFLSRMAQLSGRTISQTALAEANVRVLVVNEDERRAALPDMQAFVGSVEPATLAALRDPAKSTYCLALTVDANNDRIIEKALVIIRAETPDLLRLTCIHEELAQMMGLTNDDPGARPSIFNDDEEFATLTRMDEYLLRILYDPRLRPGMTESEGKGVVETIAAGLLASANGT
jgi:hypothetical protein